MSRFWASLPSAIDVLLFTLTTVYPSLTTLTIVRYCAINWPLDIVMSADVSLHAPFPEKHTTALTARTQLVIHSMHRLRCHAHTA